MTWLTVREAADYARMKSTQPITQAVRDGDLQAVNPFKGNAIKNVRISRAAMDEWLASKPYEPGVSA